MQTWKLDKLDIIKVKNFALWKLVKNKKARDRLWENISKTHLIKDLCPEKLHKLNTKETNNQILQKNERFEKKLLFRGTEGK